MALWTGHPTQALPGSRMSKSIGLRSIINYNGFVFNDHSVVDQYRITSISGLSLPGVRDAREPNPASHGDTALTPYYDGRTMLFTGYIKAYNLDKLDDMRQALEEAFIDLQEFPMVFKNPLDSSRDMMIYCRLFGQVEMNEESSQHAGFSFIRKFSFTMRASDPRIYSTTMKNYYQRYNLITRFPNDGVYDWTKDFSASGPTPVISASGLQVASSGTPSVVMATGLRNEEGNSMQRVAAGFNLGASAAGALFIPFNGRANFADGWFAKVNIAGASSTLSIGKRVAGVDTIYATSASSFGLSPGTTYYVRVFANNSTVTASFYATSDPTTNPSAVTSVSYSFTNSEYQAVRTYPRYAGLSSQLSAGSVTWTLFVTENRPSSLSYTAGDIINAGNFDARPRIRLTGPVKQPQLNVYGPDGLETGRLVSNGTIPNLGYWEYDPVEETLIDDLGNDVYAQLDSSSTSISLKKGTNGYALTGTDIMTAFNSAYSGSGTRVDFFYNDTFL